MYTSTLSLLIGISVLLAGNALLGTILGVRATTESFSDAVVGIVMSAYFVGFILGTFWCPGIIRRTGHIRAFAAMAAVASAAAFSHVLFINPFAWALLRLLTGLCLVGLYMIVESWLNERAAPTHRSRVFAVYVTLTLLAMASGQALLLVDPAGGPLAFGLAAAFFSLGLVPVATTDLPEPVPASVPRLRVRNLYETAPLAVLGSFTAGFANSGFWGMGAIFAQRIGLSGGATAAFMGATILGGAVLQWPIGRVSDHVDRRTVLMLVCLSAAGVAVVGLVLAGISSTALIACFFVYGGLAFSVYGLSLAHLNDHLQASQMLESARGILFLFGVGAAVGPMVAGAVMKGFGPGSLLAYFAIAYGLLSVLAAHRRKVAAPVPVEVQSVFVPMARVSQAALRMYPSSRDLPGGGRPSERPTAAPSPSPSSSPAVDDGLDS